MRELLDPRGRIVVELGGPDVASYAGWVTIEGGAHRSRPFRWAVVFGLGAVGGIGFTVSLFIAGLSFPGEELLTADAKLGILIGSAASAALGVVMLLVGSRGHHDDESEEESTDGTVDEPSPA